MPEGDLRRDARESCIQMADFAFPLLIHECKGATGSNRGVTAYHVAPLCSAMKVVQIL